MPVSRSTCGRQPKANRRELSINLRGMPSGLAVSQTMSPVKADDPLHGLRQLAHGHFAAGTDVDELLLAVILQQEHASPGQVIGVQELAQRRAGAPAGDGGRVGRLGLVELADERGQDVRVLQVIIVIRPVQIGGHGADEIAAVLAAVGLAQLEAGDLGHGVPFVGRLQRPGQQVFLLERLRGQPRINAGAAEKQQLAHAGLISAVDEVVLDLQVLEQELRRVLVVRQDAPHFGRRVQNVFGLFLRVELTDGRCVQQVQLGMRAADQAGKTAPLQLAPDRAAHQAAVAGDVNPSVSGNVHALSIKRERPGKQARMSERASDAQFPGPVNGLRWL